MRRRPSSGAVSISRDRDDVVDRDSQSRPGTSAFRCGSSRCSSRFRSSSWDRLFRSSRGLRILIANVSPRHFKQLFDVSVMASALVAFGLVAGCHSPRSHFWGGPGIRAGRSRPPLQGCAVAVTFFVTLFVWDALDPSAGIPAARRRQTSRNRDCAIGLHRRSSYPPARREGAAVRDAHRRDVPRLLACHCGSALGAGPAPPVPPHPGQDRARASRSIGGVPANPVPADRRSDRGIRGVRRGPARVPGGPCATSGAQCSRRCMRADRCRTTGVDLSTRQRSRPCTRCPSVSPSSVLGNMGRHHARNYDRLSGREAPRRSSITIASVRSTSPRPLALARTETSMSCCAADPGIEAVSVAVLMRLHALDCGEPS